MQDLVEALASYTQRHFVRMDRLVRSTFLLDYTLASMNVLMPSAGTDDLGVHGVDEPEGPWTDVDVDASTGTDVDIDACMQPAIDIQADADTQAVLADQQPQEVIESDQPAEIAGQQGDELQMQQEVQAQRDECQQSQQQAPKESKDAKNIASKRRKSAPQPIFNSVVGGKAGSQTAVKVKRKRSS